MSILHRSRLAWFLVALTLLSFEGFLYHSGPWRPQSFTLSNLFEYLWDTEVQLEFYNRRSGQNEMETNKHEQDYTFWQTVAFISQTFALREKDGDLGRCVNTTRSKLCCLWERTSTFKGNRNQCLAAGSAYTTGSKNVTLTAKSASDTPVFDARSCLTQQAVWAEPFSSAAAASCSVAVLVIQLVWISWTLRWANFRPVCRHSNTMWHPCNLGLQRVLKHLHCLEVHVLHQQGNILQEG